MAAKTEAVNYQLRTEATILEAVPKIGEEGQPPQKHEGTPVRSTGGLSVIMRGPGHMPEGRSPTPTVLLWHPHRRKSGY